MVLFQQNSANGSGDADRRDRHDDDHHDSGQKHGRKLVYFRARVIDGHGVKRRFQGGRDLDHRPGCDPDDIQLDMNAVISSGIKLPMTVTTEMNTE